MQISSCRIATHVSGPLLAKTFAELSIGQGASASEALRGDLSDGRIGAVVTLNLGAGPQLHACEPRQYTHTLPGDRRRRKYNKTVAAKGEISATREDSRYLVRYPPAATSRYCEIADTLNFSFMQICKPGAVQIIEEKSQDWASSARMRQA
jgi:hypothetical protein